MQYLEHRLSSFFEKSEKSSCKSNLFLIKCHHIYGLAKETMAERKFLKMRKGIHPEYRTVVFMDTTTGYKFLSGSTKNSKETVEFEGETYPLIRVEISSDSHPFYTGRQKFTQADGRVDKFNKKYGIK